MEELIRVVKKYYKEGSRFSIANSLFGSMAVNRVPIHVARQFYDKIKNLDDENRSNLIERTYKRFTDKEKMVSLSNKNDVASREISLALVNVVSGMSVKDDVKYVDDNDLYEIFYKIESNVNHEVDLEEISNPITSHLTPMSYQYLQSRNINIEDINKWNIRSGTGWYDGRAIFPVYHNRKCVMVVGRSYVGHNLKYKYSKGSRSRFIWNYDNVVDGNSVIVCEGIISAISAYKHSSINSVAILGSHISNEQKIMLSRFDNIILCFDPDISESVVSSMAESFNKCVKIMRLPNGTDPNDVSSNIFMANLNDSKVVDEFEFMKTRIL